MAEKSCACEGAPKLIVSCSGAADVGAISDEAARKLARRGVGKMHRLAEFGDPVGPIMETARKAATILAIDGCSLDCVKNTLRWFNFKDYRHVRVTDLGLETGKSPVSEENIGKVAAAGAEDLV